LQYVFWISIFIVLPFIGNAARFEARMFNDPAGFSAMLLVLSIAFFYLHWRVNQRSKVAENVKFEEAHTPEISALVLRSE